MVHRAPSSSSVSDTNRLLTYKHVSVITMGEIQILRLLTAVLQIVSGDLNGEGNGADRSNRHVGRTNFS